MCVFFVFLPRSLRFTKWRKAPRSLYVGTSR